VKDSRDEELPTDDGMLLGLIAYFSVYYYTKCVLLKAGCATRKVCNIEFLR